MRGGRRRGGSGFPFREQQVTYSRDGIGWSLGIEDTVGISYKAYLMFNSGIEAWDMRGYFESRVGNAALHECDTGCFSPTLFAENF